MTQFAQFVLGSLFVNMDFKQKIIIIHNGFIIHETKVEMRLYASFVHTNF